MPDEPNPTPPVVTEIPTPPAPPAEPVDDRGVPLKNVIAELSRKLEDQQKMNTEYQRLLGQYSQQQTQPKPVQGDDLEGQFDETTRKYVRSVAQQIAREEAKQIAYSMVTRAQLTQEIQSDPEIQKVANDEFNILAQNPLFANLPQEAKEAMAIANAKAKVMGQRYEAARKGNSQTAMQQAAAAQAAGASIPGTQATGLSSSTDRETYIKEFINDPMQREYLRKMWKLDPDSPEGQAKLKRTAEFGWKGSPISEKFAQGIEMIKKGGAV